MVYCDNEAVVAVLSSHYCKELRLMHMLRVLFFAEAYVLPVQTVSPTCSRHQVHVG